MSNKYYYGSTSEKRKATCDPRIRLVFDVAIAMGLIDISIIEGERSMKDQNRYFSTGKSKVKWPDSKHNVVKPGGQSLAIDAAPYINDKISFDYNRCCLLAGIILAIGKTFGVVIRWGGCWSGNPADIGNQNLNDLCHYEVIE